MEMIDYGSMAAKLISEYKLPSQPAGLYEPVAYALDCGGKRLRLQLVLAACEAAGGELDSATDAALGIEMFHNFTLLHDDVMDRADLRRGRPTVHVKWDDVTAILSGDAMLTLATQLIGRVSPEYLPRALELFNRTAMEVYEGQQYDMDYEKQASVSVAQYIEMIRLKTSVLLGCACRMGALVAGASETTQQAMYDYGVNLGLAFQLRDDWLDTYGDPAVFGKAVGGDIVNRKKTWLLITALTENHEELADILAEDLEDAELIKQVKGVYDELKLSERCDAMIGDYARRAIKALDTVDMPEASRRWFTHMAQSLSTRMV